jgi:hypothetical protein
MRREKFASGVFAFQRADDPKTTEAGMKEATQAFDRRSSALQKQKHQPNTAADAPN